jgi:uncharacterized protein
VIYATEERASRPTSFDQAKEAEMSIEDDNVQIVKEFMEAFSDADTAGTLALMHDDATWWLGGETDISGTYDKPAFGKLVDGVGGATKTGKIRMTPSAFTAQGERVAVEAESYAEMNDGRVYNNLYHFIFVIADGKIQSVKDYSDTKHIQEALC